MDTSWRTGLVGRNGQEKSTLLNLLVGHLEPSAGSLELSEQTLYFPMSVDQALNTLPANLDAIAPFRYWEGRMEELLADRSERALIEYSEIQEQYQAR
ncbi:MAG: ATP-binding cassette domain-containing protein [Gammaproteobacteria bacterium]|jgi:lincosamide and streptogramin A transport system ATP-binding/permease protein|nr:ATP-binding cassette domain-containing protein [Gammaproteobacteria bacterium]MBT5202755.1 ATP-binding cassette domain-containing protein [Gammaproteobacteria bacterium]MBT5600755.1 ATP-binding cassette domain-containing protein [Gammaproteobacteria bacterium]MBT5817903.1 ATP-binding cassette domain-containing protein [Pseudomonadota bacterium]